MIVYPVLGSDLHFEDATKFFLLFEKEVVVSKLEEPFVEAVCELEKRFEKDSPIFVFVMCLNIVQAVKLRQKDVNRDTCTQYLQTIKKYFSLINKLKRRHLPVSILFLECLWQHPYQVVNFFHCRFKSCLDKDILAKKVIKSFKEPEFLTSKEQFIDGSLKEFEDITKFLHCAFLTRDSCYYYRFFNDRVHKICYGDDKPSESYLRTSMFKLQFRSPPPSPTPERKTIFCLGAAQTFGRYSFKPYPEFLGELVNKDREEQLIVANLAIGGAGYFFYNQKPFIDLINRSGKVCLIQVLSGRSSYTDTVVLRNCFERNEISDHVAHSHCVYDFLDKFETYKGHYDFLPLEHSNNFLIEYINKNGLEKSKKFFRELTHNSLEEFKEFCLQIKVPKVLLYIGNTDFDDKYYEKVGSKSEFIRKAFLFPSLIQKFDVDYMRKYVDKYLELKMTHNYVPSQGEHYQYGHAIYRTFLKNIL